MILSIIAILSAMVWLAIETKGLTVIVIVGSILAVWLLIVGVLWIVGRKYKNKGVK